VIVGKANSKAKPHVYDQVNITVTDFSPASQFPFKLTAKLPAGGDADISGKAGPINSADAAKTPFSSTVKVDKMDIAASGFHRSGERHCGTGQFRRYFEFRWQQSQGRGYVHGKQDAVLP